MHKTCKSDMKGVFNQTKVRVWNSDFYFKDLNKSRKIAENLWKGKISQNKSDQKCEKKLQIFEKNIWKSYENS